MTDAFSVMQDDMAELLRALGLSDAARDASPHEVMVNEIIPAVRSLRGRAQGVDWQRVWEAERAAMKPTDPYFERCTQCGHKTYFTAAAPGARA